MTTLNQIHSMKTLPSFISFKQRHALALADLARYAAQDQTDADCLNPVIYSRTMAEMITAAPSLYHYASCSAGIDHLYHSLLDLAITA